MKKLDLNNSKGFTMVELLVAAGIMAVVVFGGFKAFEYFNKQTVSEAKKMDDISEFNALTKDLLQFTEGAGISTFYLNLPIKTSGCDDKEPCVRELVGNNFAAPTETLPTGLTNNTCIQFYKDAKGNIESKLAYPGKPKKDLIWTAKDLELSLTKELYATWVIKDETSPPFMMVKSRDSSLYLRMINHGPVHTAASEESHHNGLKHAFYVSEAPKEAIKKLVGYPFLVYSAYYSGQYLIQYASEIISCEESPSACKTLMAKLDPSVTSKSDAQLATDLSVPGFPLKTFAIELKEMDFNAPFFKNIFDRQNLPSNCLTQWGNGSQPSSGTFFPSKVTNLTKDPNDSSEVFGSLPQKVLYLPKYSFERAGITSQEPGRWVALPIDIISFKAEPNPSTTQMELVSEMWHLTETKKKTKIHKLSSPFTITRKLGSPEMGIWYNPIKNKSP